MNPTTHSLLFLADGFEEIEALATVDMLRRAGMTINTVTINPDSITTGAHGVPVKADSVIDDVTLSADTDWLILPGGMPGATNLASDQRVCHMLTAHYKTGGRIAAICASPAVVLAPLGIINGRSVTCYPGFEDALDDGCHTGSAVETNPTLITANGPGSTAAFALAIITATMGNDAAQQVARGMLL